MLGYKLKWEVCCCNYVIVCLLPAKHHLDIDLYALSKPLALTHSECLRLIFATWQRLTDRHQIVEAQLWKRLTATRSWYVSTYFWDQLLELFSHFFLISSTNKVLGKCNPQSNFHKRRSYTAYCIGFSLLTISVITHFWKPNSEQKSKAILVWQYSCIRFPCRFLIW